VQTFTAACMKTDRMEER